MHFEMFSAFREISPDEVHNNLEEMTALLAATDSSDEGDNTRPMPALEPISGAGIAGTQYMDDFVPDPLTCWHHRYEYGHISTIRAVDWHSSIDSPNVWGRLRQHSEFVPLPGDESAGSDGLLASLPDLKDIGEDVSLAPRLSRRI